MDCKDLINEMVNDIYKKESEDTENCIIDFLKKHGYRPKRTAKYMQNLQKRLRKKGLELQIIKYEGELKLNADGSIIKEMRIEPIFKKIDKYRIEIWQYHSKADEYESNDLKAVLKWFREKWLWVYDNDGCSFSVFENDRRMSFEEEYDLGFYDREEIIGRKYY